MKFVMRTILWPNLQTFKKYFWNKDFEYVTTVKLFSNKKFNVLRGFLMPFLFQLLIKGKYTTIFWFVTVYCLDMAPKIHNNSKFSKEQEIFANWAIDGAHDAFHKNWLH